MLARLILNSCDPPASGSQSAGVTGVSHRARPTSPFLTQTQKWLKGKETIPARVRKASFQGSCSIFSITVLLKNSSSASWVAGIIGTHHHAWPIFAILVEIGLVEMARKGTLIHCWWECKLVHLLWKIVWWFLKDLKIKLPFDLAIALLGIYGKEYKIFHYKDTYIWMFIETLVTIAKTWNQSKCPSMTDRIFKMRLVYGHHGMRCSHKKEWEHVFCGNMNEAEGSYP